MTVNAQYLPHLLTSEFCCEPITPLLLRLIENRAHQFLEQWKSEGSIESLSYTVICDKSNNPHESIKQGILNIELRPPDWWMEQEWERLCSLANGDSDGPETERRTST